MDDTKNVMIRKEMLDWTADIARKKNTQFIKFTPRKGHLKYRVYLNFEFLNNAFLLFYSLTISNFFYSNLNCKLTEIEEVC